MTPDRLRVHVLTGFLGSGKTTLLQKLLRSEGGARTAVLINEFGEIGIDHLIVRSVSPAAVVLQNGCICCTIRTDLRAGLCDLINLDQGSGRPFERIVVETTGIADPVPIVQTLVNDPMLRYHVRLAGLISTVDGLQGLGQIETLDEARRQAATADRLVLTKTDIGDPRELERLRSLLATINPTAPVIDPTECDDLWGALLGRDAFDPSRGTEEVRSWFRALENSEPGAGHRHAHRPEPMDDGAIRSFSFQTERSLDWTTFAVWLSALLHRHGSKVLRVKGLLNVPESDSPVLLNAVRSFVHPPVHLDAWPDEDRASRIVFITQGLEPNLVRGSLQHALGLSPPAEARRSA